MIKTNSHVRPCTNRELGNEMDWFYYVFRILIKLDYTAIQFVWLIYVPGNSYGHGGTFSWSCLNKRLTSTSCAYFHW